MGPSPWVPPLGAGPRWGGVDAHHTSPTRPPSVITLSNLPPFRSINPPPPQPPPPVPNRDFSMFGTKNIPALPPQNAVAVSVYSLASARLPNIRKWGRRAAPLVSLVDGDLWKIRTSRALKILHGPRSRPVSYYNRHPPPGPPWVLTDIGRRRSPEKIKEK